jgi:diguanylate cyclase (GGDEF)-like protein
MKEHCRSTDLAVRYGGDEFAVILIDSDKGMAEQVAHGIENGLRTDQGTPSISVTIGIGVYPEDGTTAAELIEAARPAILQLPAYGAETHRLRPPTNSQQQARRALTQSNKRSILAGNLPVDV